MTFPAGTMQDNASRIIPTAVAAGSCWCQKEKLVCSFLILGTECAVWRLVNLLGDKVYFEVTRHGGKLACNLSWRVGFNSV